MSEMLIYNQSLASLILHWNKIKNKGAAEIAIALIENNSLKIFDISYNSIRATNYNSNAAVKGAGPRIATETEEDKNKKQ